MWSGRLLFRRKRRQGWQVESSWNEGAGSSECRWDRAEHEGQHRAGWEMNPAGPVIHLPASTSTCQPGHRTFGCAAALACTPAPCACLCLSFAAKTPASLLPAGLCTLFHFQFNRIDVARHSQDTWHCSAWLWQCFQQKGERKEDCQEAISFSCGPTVPPASCERQAWRILSRIFKLKCLMFSIMEHRRSSLIKVSKCLLNAVFTSITYLPNLVIKVTEAKQRYSEVPDFKDILTSHYRLPVPSPLSLRSVDWTQGGCVVGNHSITEYNPSYIMAWNHLMHMVM